MTTNVWFQASTVVNMRSALFWDFAITNHQFTPRKIPEEHRSLMTTQLCTLQFLRMLSVSKIFKYLVTLYGVCLLTGTADFHSLNSRVYLKYFSKNLYANHVYYVLTLLTKWATWWIEVSLTQTGQDTWK